MSSGISGSFLSYEGVLRKHTNKIQGKETWNENRERGKREEGREKKDFVEKQLQQGFCDSTQKVDSDWLQKKIKLAKSLNSALQLISIDH